MNAVAHPLLLQLSETNAHGRQIAMTVAGYEIRGQLALDGASLDLHGPEGTLSAARVSIASVTITGPGVRLSAQQLEAAQCTIGWGHGGVQIEAATVDIHALQLIGDDEPLEGALVLEGISLGDLAVHRDDVRVGHARIEHTEIDAKLPARHAADTSAPSREPATDANAAIASHLMPILDRLTGHINVDLGLDLAVPVIGHRRATHEFRIPIDRGTLDYRRLEDNLSTLEDSLLDFSVRDEGLVLEVGIPLLPTRGKGKPIVTWPLDAADRELAQQQRVRISVLAHPHVNGRSDDHGADDDKPSRFSLRRADARNLDVNLAIAPVAGSPIHVGAFVLVGDLTLAATSDEGPADVVRGKISVLQVEGFALRLADTTASPTRDGAGGEHAHASST